MKREHSGNLDDPCRFPKSHSRNGQHCRRFVGGATSYSRERLGSALEIDLHSTFKTLGTQQLFAFIEVQLTNKGKVKLGAKNRQSSPAYSDKVEQLRYSGSLKLKKIKAHAASAKWIDWFNDSSFEDASDEINLLHEYENPEQGTDFWMEPGEVYTLGVPLTLTPGIYLAKVTFIGSRSNEEFWSRVMMIDANITN
jgi:hypothetical protein